MSGKNVSLGAIARITSGSTPSRENPSYWNGTIPWVKTAQIQNGWIREDDVDERITEKGMRSSSTRLYPKGTILMAMYGQGKTRGQVAILGLDATINQACAAIQLEDSVDRDYVYQQLIFRYDAIRALSNIGGQDNLNTDLIREISFPLPELCKQKAAAEILSAWDVSIDKFERLIAAKQAKKTGLVSELLTRRASDWPRALLSEISDRVQRQDPGGERPLLTISSASGFVRQGDKYSRNMAGESAKTYTALNEGEFSYNKGNSLRYQFGCVYQLRGFESALVPSVYVSFKLHEGIDHAYMRHLFASDYLRPQLRALVKTGVRNNGLLNISPAEFLSTTVPLPPTPKQEEIGKALSLATSEIDLLQQQLKVLRRQKRGLMQKLLTCEWHPVTKESKAG